MPGRFPGLVTDTSRYRSHHHRLPRMRLKPSMTQRGTVWYSEIALLRHSGKTGPGKKRIEYDMEFNDSTSATYSQATTSTAQSRKLDGHQSKQIGRTIRDREKDR